MSPAGERLEAPTGLPLESRLAQGASVDDDLGVPRDHQGAVPPPGRDGPCLGQGVGEDELLRSPLGRLLDLCRDRPEVEAQRLEQRLALRRGRGQD